MRIIIYLLLIINLYGKDNIKIVTEIYEPLQFLDKNDNQKGIAIEIVKAIQKKVDNTEDIKFYPWNRSYNLAIKKENFMVFSTVRAKQRENLFKWVGPILPYHISFFKRFDDENIYKSLDDIKYKKITVIRNSMCHILLKDLKFKNLDVISDGDYTEGLIKLVNKEADIFVGDGLKNQYIINQKALSKSIVKIDDEIYINKSSYYLAFNKNTDDTIIYNWQKALDELKKDGTIDKIIQSYY